MRCGRGHECNLRRWRAAVNPDSPHILREMLAADYAKARFRGDRAAMKRIGKELRRMTILALVVEMAA